MDAEPGLVGVSNNRTGRSKALKPSADEIHATVSEVPLSKSTVLRGLAAASNISKSTLIDTKEKKKHYRTQKYDTNSHG